MNSYIVSQGLSFAEARNALIHGGTIRHGLMVEGSHYEAGPDKTVTLVYTPDERSRFEYYDIIFSDAEMARTDWRAEKECHVIFDTHGEDEPDEPAHCGQDCRAEIGVCEPLIQRAPEPGEELPQVVAPAGVEACGPQLVARDLTLAGALCLLDGNPHLRACQFMAGGEPSEEWMSAEGYAYRAGRLVWMERDGDVDEDLLPLASHVFLPCWAVWQP